MIDEVCKRGLVLIGCGFMGRSLLEGWLSKGVAPEAFYVSDPNPSAWLAAQTEINVNTPLPADPAAVFIATKPQILDHVLPPFAHLGNAYTVVVSIAAGVGVARFETAFGADTPIVRAMPNLPATVGEGITALYCNGNVTDAQRQLITELFEGVGTVVDVDEEQQLHAITALSGSGPAYAFAFADALSKAGTALGLAPEMAKTLAYQTLKGAGCMLTARDADAVALRNAVTSKGGTTAAGLSEFGHEINGVDLLVQRTLDAAHCRSIELSNT